MQLHPRMKAGLLLLTIAGTVVAMSPSVQARDGRGGRGGRGWERGRGWDGGWRGGWGGYGGYGWYGGYPSYGYGYGGYDYPSYGYSYAPDYGGTYTNYAPTQPMYSGQQYQRYQSNGEGCGPTTAAYPPSGPMPGTPGGYNGTTYNGGPPNPTYAPGAAPGAYGGAYGAGGYGSGRPGQPGDNAGQRNPEMNQQGNAPQTGATGGTANQQNTAPPPAPGSSSPQNPRPTSGTP
jgi:hypothetical protein